ncbi:cell division protein FtsA [Bacteroides pyogenes]|uniref:cell division protein FtsA n=1 Tax=Bacteroides pyogenes TaxID=310300 RepID=UPI002A91757C|nr:cell division protein FtsA [Bacteroides pyogenes]MDY5432946.1 cell division protein FtsA [Bacteroides pyogenes]
MATTEFIAAIELGSSKIAGVAGKKNSDGSMQVLAYAQEDSSTFIRKGIIFNLDKTAQSLTSIINRLESELKNSIAKVYVGIGGQSIRTVRNVVSRDLEEETVISEKIVSNIGDENISVPLVDMEVLEVAPQEYKIGNNLQANPVGVVGSHIEGRFLNIVARASLRKNLEHCFRQAKIEIAEQLVSPLVTANAVLTESERRSGCALVDFGADTTTISVYKNNILRFLTVLPLGGNSITRDITTLQIEEEEAERLKKTYGDALYEEEEENEEQPAVCKLEDESRTITVSQLNEIIGARAEEIISNVWNQIQLSGYEDKLLAGLVITGGATNLKNLDEMLRKRSKIDKIRVAKLPRNTVHAYGEILKKDGSQNTLFGLLFEGNQNCCLMETVQPEAVSANTHPGLKTDGQAGRQQTGDMFEDDLELQEQARQAKLKREQEEKAAKAAAKEEERKRKERERKEEEARKKAAGPSWIQRKIEAIAKDFFEGDKMN